MNALAQDGIEIMPPLLSNFFMQSFVNRREKNRTLVKKSSVPEFITDGIYSLIKRKIEAVNRTASQFRFFTPFEDIFKEADNARGIVSLSAQFGEGWELPAEIVSYVHRGVNNVICLQPFGCIANHIVAKGVEKKIKNLYPELNLLFLDFDSGVSDVNVSNRVLLFTDNLK